jgi:predicted GNAT family N-acyltransferase
MIAVEHKMDDRRMDRGRNDPLTVSVVRSLDEYMEAVALRARVFMAEQDCPYNEEFDGNDLAANHLIARIDGEPVATCRIRWFADFAKIERVCIHPSHRSLRLLRAFVSEIFEYCSRKGYRKAISYTQAHRTRQWEKFGFRLREHRPTIRFSDYEYVEFEVDLDPHPHALHAEAPAELLNRPEGAWDAPGILEQSAARGAMNASERHVERV